MKLVDAGITGLETRVVVRYGFISGEIVKYFLEISFSNILPQIGRKETGR